MILGLETSTVSCSVALATIDGRLLAEMSAPAGPAHTRRLLADIHHVLSMVGAELSEVTTVVVGLGPGTFTGLRIGVATARALAQATGANLVGVPTLASLALALADGDAAAKATAFVPLIDGKRGEVFAACYARGPGFAVRCADEEPPSAALEVVHGLATVSAADLHRFLAPWTPAIVGGDGASLYAAQLPACAHRSRSVLWPTAAMLLSAWRAGVPGVVEGADDVLPVYGRAPDAARWTQREPTAGPVDEAGGIRSK